MAADLKSLVAQLADADAGKRAAAAEKLSGMAEDAAPAAVALVSALGDQDESVRELVTSTLEGLGPPPQKCVDELEPLLAHQNADIAYWAATLLGRLDGGAIQAVEALKTAAADHASPEVRKRATWALGKIASG